MRPKPGKYLKLKRIEKFRLKKVVTILPKKNVSQIKPTSQFQELTVGMIVPSSLGAYEILSELAVGRCCEVYIGENSSSKTQDAIKVFIRQQHYKGALLRELKFLAKLSPHPHIVTPKGSFQYEGRDILVHELLSGTLKDILAMHEGRTPSTWLITTLAKHLMRGLAHIHKHGVVHGDLKLHNIMWSGQEETFKLIDFGVSFSLNENMEHAVQSRAYQAPETVQWNQWVQLKGGSSRSLSSTPPKPGPPVDVWSAGCIVAEVLTGGKVFLCGWNGEDVEDSLKGALRKVDDKANDFLSSAFIWLKRCLEEDSRKRWRAEECERTPFLESEVCERPSFLDLLILPTTVLRVMNLIRTDMERSLAYDLVESVIEKASSVSPSDHVLDDKSGSLYLQYDDIQASENSFQTLKHSTVKGFTLVPSFFPRHLFDQRIFF